jgi:hypothetical protein
MRSLCLSLSLAFFPIAAYAQADHKVTKADVDRWMTELSNWGRWGKDDQMGALNFITPSTRKEAARLVKDGYSVSLEHDVLTERTPENPAPYTITWNARGPQFA